MSIVNVQVGVLFSQLDGSVSEVTRHDYSFLILVYYKFPCPDHTSFLQKLAAQITLSFPARIVMSAVMLGSSKRRQIRR